MLLGVKEVYAKVISKLAEEVLLGHGIAVFCGTRTERIRSYAGGYCPMETAVEHCEDAESALAAILKRLAVTQFVEKQRNEAGGRACAYP